MISQPDGKIIVVGSFDLYNNVTARNIIRLNNSGSKDSTFGVGTGLSDSVRSVLSQPDQKIIVGGSFTSYNGITENRIIRFNSNGTKDISFNTGTGFDGVVNTIVLQNNGKIVVGGIFSSYNGVLTGSVVRLNNDGTRDTTFNTSFNNNFQIFSMAPQPDGKIILGGQFISYNGIEEKVWFV